MVIRLNAFESEENKVREVFQVPRKVRKFFFAIKSR